MNVERPIKKWFEKMKKMSRYDVEEKKNLKKAGAPPSNTNNALRFLLNPPRRAKFSKADRPDESRRDVVPDHFVKINLQLSLD